MRNFLRFGQTATLNLVLLVIGTILAGTNMWLLHENHHLQATSKAASQAEIGQVVPDLNGVDFQNNPIRVGLADHRSTLVMVLSPTCPFCAKNWSNWNALLDTTDRARIGVVLVDISTMAKPAYVAEHKITNATFFHELSPTLVNSLRLNLTPQTILIGADHRVKAVWTGALTPDDLQSIKSMIS